MRTVEYENEKGRKYLVKLADETPDKDAHMGIPIGPPDVVDALELPEPFATTLHNILYDRGLWSIKEVNAQKKALFGALQAALKVDVHTLYNAYDSN